MWPGARPSWVSFQFTCSFFFIIVLAFSAVPLGCTDAVQKVFHDLNPGGRRWQPKGRCSFDADVESHHYLQPARVHRIKRMSLLKLYSPLTEMKPQGVRKECPSTPTISGLPESRVQMMNSINHHLRHRDDVEDRSYSAEKETAFYIYSQLQSPLFSNTAH